MIEFGAFLRFDKYPSVAGIDMDKAGDCESERDSVPKIFEGNCRSGSDFGDLMLGLDGSGLLLRLVSVLSGNDRLGESCRGCAESFCSLDMS